MKKVSRGVSYTEPEFGTAKGDLTAMGGWQKRQIRMLDELEE